MATTERIALKPAEAAESLGVSRAKVYELVAAGVLPSVRVGSSIRIPVGALNLWVEEQLAAGSSLVTR